MSYEQLETLVTLMHQQKERELEAIKEARNS